MPFPIAVRDVNSGNLTPCSFERELHSAKGGPPSEKISSSWGALGVRNWGQECGCLESGGKMERAVVRSAECHASGSTRSEMVATHQH
jgi:hypothetical protein